MIGKIKIYALYDSEEPLQVRYVGQTSNDLGHRRSGHIQRPVNAKMREWIKMVGRKRIKIKELSEHETPEEALQAETKWIDFWSLYCDLLNQVKPVLPVYYRRPTRQQEEQAIQDAKELLDRIQQQKNQPQWENTFRSDTLRYMMLYVQESDQRRKLKGKRKFASTGL